MILLGDVKWKKLFNRFLDSSELDYEDLEKLLSIEERISENVRKQDIKEWTGSAEQNSVCDYKVSKSVKSSFQYYEKAKTKKDISYFKFSK